jgi:hypothetical protein
VSALFGSLSIPKGAEQNLEGESGSKVAARMMDEVARIKAIRVLNREVEAEDTVVLTFVNEMKYPDTNRAFMKRNGNEWKLDPD